MQSRFLGAIVGCAVGDALGAPFEGWPGEAIQKVRDLTAHFTGQYTDDTQLTLALTESIIERGGVDPADVAARFLSTYHKGIIGIGRSTMRAMKRLEKGLSWRDSGDEVGNAGNGCAMRASPIGLWDFDAPDRLVEDAVNTSIITHKDSRAAAGAVAVASAVAYLASGERLEVPEFLEVIGHRTGQINNELEGFIFKIPEWLKADEGTALQEMLRAGWESRELQAPGRKLDGCTPFVIPTVLVSLYSFLKSPGDFMGSLIRAVRVGGDVDTLGAITGAISGTYNGIEGIPTHLVNHLKDSGMIQDMAQRLFIKRRQSS